MNLKAMIKILILSLHLDNTVSVFNVIITSDINQVLFAKNDKVLNKIQKSKL